MLLTRHIKYRSNRADELEHFLRASAGARVFDVPSSGAGLNVNVNVAKLHDIELVSVGTNIGNVVSYEPVDFVRQLYPIRGRMGVAISTQDTRGLKQDGGIIVPGDMPWELSHGNDFESLTVRISRRSLERILQPLIGHPLSKPLSFEPSSSADSQRVSMLRNSVFQFANEVDAAGSIFSPLAWAEFEQALIVRFLLCTLHNYSDLFAKDDPEVGTRQLRRVEEYITANWDKQLDTSSLAEISGSSARTLFRVFQKKYGCSPYAFIKTIRLNKARLMLMNSNANESVISVALRCGFHSLGHFAKSYQARFGELPSQTLRHRRSDGGSALN